MDLTLSPEERAVFEEFVDEGFKKPPHIQKDLPTKRMRNEICDRLNWHRNGENTSRIQKIYLKMYYERTAPTSPVMSSPVNGRSSQSSVDTSGNNGYLSANQSTCSTLNQSPNKSVQLPVTNPVMVGLETELADILSFIEDSSCGGVVINSLPRNGKKTLLESVIYHCIEDLGFDHRHIKKPLTKQETTDLEKEIRESDKLLITCSGVDKMEFKAALLDDLLCQFDRLHHYEERIKIVVTCTSMEVGNLKERFSDLQLETISINKPDLELRMGLITRFWQPAFTVPTEQLSELAGQLHGYNSGEICQMVKRNQQTTVDDMVAYIRVHPPMSIQDHVISVRKVEWDSICGYSDQKRMVADNIDRMLKSDESKSWLLFSGPPGCGKSNLAAAIASKFNLHMIAITPATILDKYVGETPKKMRHLISVAEKHAPCILFIDEADTILRKRTGGSDDCNVNLQILNEILTEDGVKSRKTNKVIFVLATNLYESLDSALQRRFVHIKIDRPKQEADIMPLLNKLFKEHPAIAGDSPEQRIEEVKWDLSKQMEMAGFTVNDIIEMFKDITTIDELTDRVKKREPTKDAGLPDQMTESFREMLTKRIEQLEEDEHQRTVNDKMANLQDLYEKLQVNQENVLQQLTEKIEKLEAGLDDVNMHLDSIHKSRGFQHSQLKSVLAEITTSTDVRLKELEAMYEKKLSDVSDKIKCHTEQRFVQCQGDLQTSRTRELEEAENNMRTMNSELSQNADIRLSEMKQYLENNLIEMVEEEMAGTVKKLENKLRNISRIQMPAVAAAATLISLGLSRLGR